MLKISPFSQIPYTKVAQLEILSMSSHLKTDFVVDFAQEREIRSYNDEGSLDFSSFAPKPMRNRFQLPADKKKRYPRLAKIHAAT